MIHLFSFVSSLFFFFDVSDGLMEPFRKYLHTYLSLSGPHLGYLYSTNSLFNSGLWLLKKLKSTQVIHQLTLTDDPDLRQTFFYKLCKVETNISTFLHCRFNFCCSVLIFGFESFSAKDVGTFQKYNSPVLTPGTPYSSPWL